MTRRRPSVNFITELSRRNVIRMALFYVVSAWLLVQVAETVLPPFEVPDGVLRGLVILLALGFVPALVIAWVFEWTPDGIRLESEARQPGSIERRSSNKLNWATLVIALLAIGLLVVDRTLLESPRPAPAIVTSPAASVDATGAAAAAAVLAGAEHPGGDGLPVDALAGRGGGVGRTWDAWAVQRAVKSP